MNEKMLWIWLSKIEISNKIKLELLNKFKNIEKIWKANADDLIYYKFSDKNIDKIMNTEYRKNLEKELDYLKKNNIKIINFLQKEYPKKLLQIPDFPIILYVKGDLRILNNKSIGIVGSRMATDYGKNVARDISKKIADKDYIIISGLARGIDKYAHLGALDSKIGKTIAVLGTGVEEESIYPLENKKIYERILEEGGAIISEYPINTKPISYNFPARNRIISGLSDKIIVVEADFKSGSLITVDYALEQGKEVWAVPGNIYSNKSRGTNKLISEGANIFIDIEELF